VGLRAVVRGDRAVGEVFGGEVFGGEVFGGEVFGGEVFGGDVFGGEVFGGDVGPPWWVSCCFSIFRMSRLG
jgi:hypothetical protein